MENIASLASYVVTKGESVMLSHLICDGESPWVCYKDCIIYDGMNCLFNLQSV